ncbi:uncharacterized protein N7496_007672 [Penicillium cataractarum]|uniref:AttH domain-containing protein n=1 Tax=Penicillium cataractarum TaxID=2100454 RepID=A0A9W9RWV4_9EURO|nr:uncharacterized protein N7496_007672 [Penicillium cataractarum]KAJ5367912.1 hypothetical protein N7496_007672 [Penicillium cataractarum]
MHIEASLSRALSSGLIIYTILTGKASAIPARTWNTRADVPLDSTAGSWNYAISSHVQNRPARARFDIPTTGSKLDTQALLTLDAPQLSAINESVFDWWYFDAVSANDSRESLTVTFFTSTATAFPWLPSNESSVLIAYVWASFANGSVFEEYVPATIARVVGGEDANSPNSGNWSSTGFSWAAPKDDLSQYEVVISSEKLQIDGRLGLTSTLAPHLPCGITSETTTLQIAPHIGWVALKPDAVGQVDINVKGSRLQFQGPAYHDKNWSDRPFTDSVQSWYWGHGQIGPYSVVWFSYLALDDPSATTYVSSYVARDGEVLVSSCNSSILTVRPTGGSENGARYPPQAGDVPDGFYLEFDLGNEGWLKANVSGTRIAGDGKYYFRWAGDMTGEVSQSGADQNHDTNAVGGSAKTKSLLAGSAIFEQFVLAE